MNTLEQKVMQNVALIYALRKLGSRTALECYALVLSLGVIGLFVSVPHVLINFLHAAQAGGIVTFLIAAVLGTTALVQLLLALGALAAGLLFVDLLLPRSSAFAA